MEYLTFAEFARRNNVSRQRVQQWLAAGRIVSRTINGVVRIPASQRRPEPRKRGPHRKAAVLA